MSIRDAVIVSTARTPIGRAYRGAFNATPVADARRAIAIRAAVERAGIDPAEIDDVHLGRGAASRARRRQHRAARRAARRAAGHRRRHDRSTASAPRA